MNTSIFSAVKSLLAVILVALVWCIAGGLYYPKWKKSYTEAAISWDVSGYYHYLPAIFIYGDLRQQEWMDSIHQKYLPSSAADQAFLHTSGNKVNKYTIGQAVLYSPFFLMAHAYASHNAIYPADGYSRPYQVAIWLGGLLCSIAGLLLLRRILTAYFDDKTVAVVLLILGMATHWLEYAAISNGLSHTWLFTLLCILILSTQRFYEKNSHAALAGIGLSIGLATLVRPTEIFWLLVPLFWNIKSVKERLEFIWMHKWKVIILLLIIGSISAIQFGYWKYVSGDWFVYSYGDQKMDWLHPDFLKGLKDTNIGWWTYTPVMILIIPGFLMLYKKEKSLFWPVFIYSFVAVYVTFSWPYWHTGGGLGQRNLIQAYPVMALALAPVISWFLKNKWRKIAGAILFLMHLYYSSWWIHEAHYGHAFVPGQMNTRFFMKTVGRWHFDRNNYKLLDTKEIFDGTPVNPHEVWSNDFEKDNLACMEILQDGNKVACLSNDVQNIGPFYLPVTSCTKWIRLQADFKFLLTEYDNWKYTQWIVEFKSHGKPVKVNFIRVNRLINIENKTQTLFFDVLTPKVPFDECLMSLWHSGSPGRLLVDNFRVLCFDQ